MENLNVAVVGVGYLGKFHAEKYFNMEGVNLKGIVDTDMGRAQKIASCFKTQAFDDYKKLFGLVGGVSIVSPTPTHFQIAKDFLLHDINVLIEKPMTTSLKEADELIEIAEDRGLILQVGHLERFNSAVMALGDIVKKPMFIESHRLSIFKNRCTDVSVVLDLMIHDIDIILGLVKAHVKSIHASGISAVSDHVDIANARLEFATGCVANVTASRISIKNERKIRFFQKDAYISVDFATREITHIRKTGKNTQSLIPGMDIKKSSYREGDSLENELKSFVKSVKEHTEPEVTGKMGRDALEVALIVMDQIRASNKRYLGI